MAVPEMTSRGVDTLIAKLRDDGVAAGRAEADRLIAEAQDMAAKIIRTAQAESEKYLTDARNASDRYRSAGEEALSIAMRDAVLTMKAGLMTQFESDVKRMVSKSLADPEMIKQMILELVGTLRDATGAGGDTEIILPAAIISAEAIADNPEEIKSGKLTKFVLGLTQEMLEEGVTLHASDDFQAGIRARIADKEVELDLSDEAITSLLMQHLQPRFRAVMEGVIK